MLRGIDKRNIFLAEEESRTGHLFQNRFKSEAVETDKYFLTVLRYINQNPVKAGLVQDMKHYKWSSYHKYFNKNESTINKIGRASCRERV